MTEIGLAQQRLLDDDASSAAHRLPSTATPYPSEISQPGSFPAMPTYQDQQMDGTVNGDFLHCQPVQDASCEATQLVPPIQAPGDDYYTPAASTQVDSRMDGSEQVTTYPAMVQGMVNMRAHMPQMGSQRSKSLQLGPYSPHDTEPMSSIVSPRLSRAKSDNTRSGPMSPPSPADTHDELSLPAVAVEIANVKKPGRQNKQSIPEDDEDDELAGPGESQLDQRKYGEKGSEHVSNTSTVNPLASDDVVAAKQVTSASDTAEKPVNTSSARTKVKRSKTADAVMRKSHIPVPDDEVIWVDSNPIQADRSNEQINPPSTIPETGSSEPLQSATTKPTDDHVLSEEKPAPKKRGRKRKQTTDQRNAELDPASKENQPPEELAKATLPQDKMDATGLLEPEPEDPTKAPQTLDSTSTSGTATLPKISINNEEHPQTPATSEESMEDPNANANTNKNDSSSTKRASPHSPIPSTGKVPYRIGLSKRARIAPLLKIVRK